MKKRGKRAASLLSVILAFAMLASVPLSVSAAVSPDGIRIISTNVDTPSDGCVLLGVEGSYITQIQESLDLINSYRLEACKEGVKTAKGKTLTVNDYVPLKWSSYLESVARIRAAEAGILRKHERLNNNGTDIYSDLDDVFNTGEIIAWNDTRTMTAGIEQWYREKSDWVNGVDGAMTSHYTAMIDPDNTYIGLASFYSSDVAETYSMGNTTVGRFSDKSGLDETQGTAVSSCIQLIEVSKSLIGDLSIDIADRDSKSSCICTLSTSVKGVSLRVLDGVEWSSGNSDMPIDSNGVLSAKAYGVSNVSASFSGKKASTDIYASEYGFSFTEPVELTLGDVNGDGVIDISDATLIQKYVARITTFTDKQIEFADTDGNGTVDINDATTVQKFAAKIISKFPTFA